MDGAAWSCSTCSKSNSCKTCSPLNRPGTANTTPVVHTLHAASGSLHDICNSDQLASTFNTYLLVLLEEKAPV